ncbi:MAG: hypothetical protein WCL57_14170 [Chloroflexota bacterium]|jgi:hypothetical protein|nr:hypothetical protein [Chloroflexota bacterium]
MKNASPRRMVATIVGICFLCIGLVACLGLGSVGLWVGYPLYQSIDYPNATESSEDVTTEWWPDISVQRAGLYRTNDEFPKVYHYYSRQFELGPERSANSNCILMARTEITYRVIEQNTSVNVCDTPSDRMMIVYRTVTVKWRKWFDK